MFTMANNSRPVPPAPVLDEHLAAALRKQSLRAKIRQAHVARAIGRSNGYMHSRWHGTAPLTIAELVTWAGLIGADADVILASAITTASRAAARA
jgi:hypothetical protein